MIFSDTFQVEALAPFNFELTAQIFGGGDKQIRSYSNGKFSQVLIINDKLDLVQLTSAGTVDQPKIEVEIKSNRSITSQDKQEVEKVIRYVFNLDFDLCSFYKEINDEPILHNIALRLYGLKNPTTPTVFEALFDSIIEQQISLKVAHTIEYRIIKKLGESLSLDGETYYAYPTPQTIALSKIGELQGFGLTERKAQYLQGAAQLIADDKLDLERLKTMDKTDEILVELDAVRGIGVWTAELIMLRGMQKLNAFPADDLGIRRVISNYYFGGKTIKTEEAREIAKSWGRWKGLAAFYLIMAEIKGITI